jgi:hypothetical protein
VRNWVFALLVSAPLLAAAAGAAKVEYIGGTLADLPGKSGGRLALSDPEALLFSSRGSTLRIPYSRIEILEYGQRVNRRYVEAVVLSPLLLLAKSRKHYLVIGYQDEEGARQSMVLRLDKDDVRSVLAGLEARTGRRVEYQDEEARRTGKG